MARAPFSGAAACLALALCACGGPLANAPGATPTPALPARKGAPGVLNWSANISTAGWVHTLDPALVTDAASLSDIQLVNANLVKVDYSTLRVKPDLAQRWTVSPDHRTWTFHLRANARFSNGDLVTAQDAAWSMTRSLLPSTHSLIAMTYLGHILGAGEVAAGRGQTLSGVKVLDAHTLQVTLDRPIAYFLSALSYPTADVLDPRVLLGKEAGQYLTNTCSANAGAGPFEFECSGAGSGPASFYAHGGAPSMRFRPNPYFYGSRPTVRINAPFHADVVSTWQAYRSGEVDATAVPGPDIPRAQTMPGFSKVAELTTDFITPNMQSPPFDNVDCRLAVAYAIDRERVTDRVLGGTEGPLFDVLPPGIPGYLGRAADLPHYDPTLARRYRALCPGRLANVAFAYQSTSPEVSREYRAVAAELRAIGATVVLRSLSFKDWVNVIGQTLQATKSQEDIAENLWPADYPDAQDWCDNLLHSGAGYNIGGFHDPRYDALVDRADVEVDTVRRAQLYRLAQRIALSSGAWIGVGYRYSATLINPRVHGLVNTPASVQPVGGDWSRVSIAG